MGASVVTTTSRASTTLSSSPSSMRRTASETALCHSGTDSEPSA